MKKLIEKTIQKSTITLDEFIQDNGGKSFKNSIIGIEVVDLDDFQKYVLTYTVTTEVIFSRGSGRWDTLNRNNGEIERALRELLKDKRVKNIFIFDDLKELGKWLIS